MILYLILHIYYLQYHNTISNIIYNIRYIILYLVLDIYIISHTYIILDIRSYDMSLWDVSLDGSLLPNGTTETPARWIGGPAHSQL